MTLALTGIGDVVAPRPGTLRILRAALGLKHEPTGRMTARSRLRMLHHAWMSGQPAMNTRSTGAYREAVGTLRALQEAMMLCLIRR